MSIHTRRHLLATAAAFAVGSGARRLLGALAPAHSTSQALEFAAAAEQAGDQSTSSPGGKFPILDVHVHLFDPTRPGGVPWPEKTDKVLYRPALPARYRGIAAPFGVVGAIAVECSPLPEDNEWLLHTAGTDPMFVGVIGDLDPADAQFAPRLERLQKNPLYRGIRYGNLWGRDLGAHLNDPEFVGNLKRLPQAGLLLESANPNPALIAAILRLTDAAPDLRIVIDHLPQAVPPENAAARDAYIHDLQSLAQRPQVFVKGSEIFRKVDGRIPEDIGFYRPWLDQIWHIFGDDRLLYGGDWPNSDQMKPYGATLGIIRQYVLPKGPVAAHKFFFSNSVAVYRWKPRDSAQTAALKSNPV